MNALSPSPPILHGHGLWSLWDVFMKAFNAGILVGAFQRMMQFAQVASTSNPDDVVPRDTVADVITALTMVQIIALFLELDETNAAAKRLEEDFRSPVKCKELQFGLHHLMELMKSQLEKRKIFAIEPDKSKFYWDDCYGINADPGSGETRSCQRNQPRYSASGHLMPFPAHIWILSKQVDVWL